MEVGSIKKEFKYGEKFHLYPIGDTHVGTIHFAENDFKRLVDRIEKDPLAMWIGMGDYGEFISPKDKRWDDQSVASWVEKDNIGESQVEYFSTLVLPIRQKCIGLLAGNHEDKMRTMGCVNVQQNLAKKLDTKNLGFSCFYRFSFSRSTRRSLITGVFTHGAGCARTKGAKINRLLSFMRSFEANLYGYAHVHDIITSDCSILQAGIDKLVCQNRVGAMTGCWFRTYTQGNRASYGEKQVYDPTTIGTVVFTIDPEKLDIKVDSIKFN
jgi:hypothetical protein